MAIAEIKEEELLRRLAAEAGEADAQATAFEAVLIYTVFCGTCQLAERMLEIVQATGISARICKMNIQYAPKLREAWAISSVPCLVLLKAGVPIHKEYAMRSVDHLYGLIRERLG